MKFNKILGHTEIKNKLISSYKDNRLSHSYLFFGTSGVGKLALAIAYAQYLSCTDKTENDSCGQCPSCIKYEKLIHPDLHFVFPIITVNNDKEKRNICDDYIKEWNEFVLSNYYFSYSDWVINLQSIVDSKSQGEIRVKESTSILNKLSYKSYESNYKIMIIWLPEFMNTEAANRILKLLEEPPENTLFFLVSDERENILSTILSRTQPIKILGIEKETLKSEIIKKYTIDENLANDIIVNCNGSMLEAQKKIIENENTVFIFEEFTKLMRITFSKDIINIINWADKISSIGREKQKNFISYSLNFLREIFVYKINSNICSMTSTEKEFAKKFTNFLTKNQVEKISKQLNDTYYYIERNANPKILLSDLAFQILYIFTEKEN
ncbi:MAG: DNA polymerase III subunit delta [Bacteroidales bacterium]|jgi:DNA polymerase-3 subunit delta'|nr:DNA polymerase III subunit delta [Bacteroidales bacterium]